MNGSAIEINRNKRDLEELEEVKFLFFGNISTRIERERNVFDEVSVDENEISISLYRVTLKAEPRPIYVDGSFLYLEYAFFYGEERERPVWVFYLKKNGELWRSVEGSDSEKICDYNDNVFSHIAIPLSKGLVDSDIFRPSKR